MTTSNKILADRFVEVHQHAASDVKAFYEFHKNDSKTDWSASLSDEAQMVADPFPAFKPAYLPDAVWDLIQAKTVKSLEVPALAKAIEVGSQLTQDVTLIIQHKAFSTGLAERYNAGEYRGWTPRLGESVWQATLAKCVYEKNPLTDIQKEQLADRVAEALIVGGSNWDTAVKRWNNDEEAKKLDYGSFVKSLMTALDIREKLPPNSSMRTMSSLRWASIPSAQAAFIRVHKRLLAVEAYRSRMAENVATYGVALDSALEWIYQEGDAEAKFKQLLALDYQITTTQEKAFNLRKSTNFISMKIGKKVGPEKAKNIFAVISVS